MNEREYSTFWLDHWTEFHLERTGDEGVLRCSSYLEIVPDLEVRFPGNCSSIVDFVREGFKTIKFGPEKYYPKKWIE